MAGDKFALVTGAGRGIGRAAALALAKAGWHVAVAGRSAEPLATAAREIEALGRRALAHPCDVADPVAVRALFAALEREFGRLDLLFNNAGAGAPAVPLGRTDLRAVEGGRRRQPDRRVPLRAGRDSPDEATEPARRAHHQQRLDFRPCAAPR